MVQLAGFTEGEILLYERLQMAPMLPDRYVIYGAERLRRQMLVMCRSDPALLGNVLGYSIKLAGGGLAGELRLWPLVHRTHPAFRPFHVFRP